MQMRGALFYKSEVKIMNKNSKTFKIKVQAEELDIAIEKANRLVNLLSEAKNLIDSLQCNTKL